MEESIPIDEKPILQLQDEGEFFTLIEQMYIECGYELLETS